RLARRHGVLEPRVPAAHEIGRQAAMHEISAARQLAEEPGTRARPALLHGVYRGQAACANRPSSARRRLAAGGRRREPLGCEAALTGSPGNGTTRGPGARTD